jgi:hypothetical protein
VQAAVEALIPPHLMPAATLINILSPNERTNVLKACLIVFMLSDSTIITRQLQLQAALAELAALDSKVISGTGSGKTLAIAIPHILCQARVSFVISPLKRLQITQVYMFLIGFRSGESMLNFSILFAGQNILNDGVSRQLR